MKAEALKQVSYDPACFLNVETVEEARDIIVTPFDKLSPQHRWDTETPYLVGLIEKWLQPRSYLIAHPTSKVLDYGCGIGRLAKPLIEKCGCDVIGVDLSPNMRALAESCLASDAFMTLPPNMMSFLVKECCDFAVSIWTLQHVLHVRDALRDIEQMLKVGGRLFVVNNMGRVVPTTAGWVDDGVDVRAVLKDCFTEIDYGRLSEAVAPESFGDNTFWAVYQK